MGRAFAVSENDGGILLGFEANGRHLVIGHYAARNRALKEGMPFVRDSRRVCFRRSTLDAWLAEREAAARKPESSL